MSLSAAGFVLRDSWIEPHGARGEPHCGDDEPHSAAREPYSPACEPEARRVEGEEWRRMLDEGVYRSQSDLARGEGVSTAAVSIALKALRG